MKLVKSSVAVVLALSITTPAIAARKTECVTEADNAAVFGSMMPDLIEGLRDKCAAHLPADAFLVASGNALIDQYKAHADQRWPAAKRAFARASGHEEIAAELPDEVLRPLVGSIVGFEMLKSVKVKDCAGANRIVENLAPLPPENVAAMLSAIVGLTEKDGEQRQVQICES